MQDRDARHFLELLQVIRDRVAELDIPHDAVDSISGIQSGYFSKLASNPPMRRASPFTLFVLLQALGLKLVVSEDPDAMALVQSRIDDAKRKKPLRKMLAASNHTVRIHLTPDFMRRNQKKGGRARADKLTPEQRSEIALKGAEAMWRNRRAKERARKAA